MSFIIHKVANPNAPVLTLRAPVTPNFSLIKNTVITKALRGMPNKFIITPRCESGTYLLRKVPMDGKYIPTQASNKKNAAERPPKIAIGEEEVIKVDEAVDFIVAKVAHAMDMVARESIPAVKFSAFTDILLTSCPNAVDPKRQHVIKQVKIVPYGVSAPGNAFPMTEVIAGGHCKTKMYIAASNKACTAPTSMILESDFTTLTASLIVGFEDSSPSLPDDDATFSFHKSEVNSAPAARKTVESSNGPVGPFFAAAIPDNFPANIATMESPA